MSQMFVVLASSAALVTACTSASTPSRPSAPSTPATRSLSSVRTPYAPHIDPANFVPRVTNPYFPLAPGTTFTYDGNSEGARERETMTVTDRQKVILGVPCTVVRDVLTQDGAAVEKTDDWYAQDRAGNVWYFGEDTAEYRNGKVVTKEGSWQGGVNGAQPGIVMPAHPAVPTSYRQEYYPGHAEDLGWVVQTGVSTSVRYGSFKDVVLTLEWTPLEPKIVGEKYYARGIGIVLDTVAAGPPERFELTSITHA